MVESKILFPRIPEKKQIQYLPFLSQWANKEMAVEGKHLQKYDPNEFEAMVKEFHQKGSNSKIVFSGKRGVHILEKPEDLGKIYRFKVDWADCMAGLGETIGGEQIPLF